MPPPVRPAAVSVLPLLALLVAGCESGPRVQAANPSPPATIRPLQERVEGPCRVLAAGGAAAEEGLSACRGAAAGLRELLGDSVPPGLVCLAAGPCDPLPGQAWAVSLPPDSAVGEPRQLGGGQTLSPEGYLIHEIAHRMATAMVFPAPLPGADTLASALYGSPLPDWLDEALALLVEPEADQRARLRLLFEGGTIQVMPLRRLLYMSHPALAGVPAGAPLRRSFYGQSLAVASFIRERAGSGGLRELVGALRSGERQGRALTSIPGLPADGGELEQAWLQWLRDRRPVLAGEG